MPRRRLVYCELSSVRLADAVASGLPAGTRVLNRPPHRRSGRLVAIDATGLSLVFSASGCELGDPAPPELLFDPGPR